MPLINYLGDKNVSVACFHVLRLPWTEDGMPQKSISSLAFMTPSVTSQLIQKLCNDGLIKRNHQDKDARKIQVFLTSEGWELRKTILDGALNIPVGACKNISDEDISTVVKALAKIRKELE